jgi:hypothetical protein
MTRYTEVSPASLLDHHTQSPSAYLLPGTRAFRPKHFVISGDVTASDSRSCSSQPGRVLPSPYPCRTNRVGSAQAQYPRRGKHLTCLYPDGEAKLLPVRPSGGPRVVGKWNAVNTILQAGAASAKRKSSTVRPQDVFPGRNHQLGNPNQPTPV